MMAASNPEPIALIGYGCRFPGKATSPSRLWEILKNPPDLLSSIPPNRFNTDGFYAADGMRHGSTNVRQAYLLEDEYRHYDAQFFGTKPVEAHAMDPQHRHLLEVVYEAVESAGLSTTSLEGSDTSVYVGLMCEDYSLHLRRDAEAIPTYLGTGTANSLLSNRISYFFDWHGESMTIDTACSSSLVAVNQAVQALRSGRCRMAVAAGSNLIMAPEQFIAESKLNMLSPGGRSRMWDCKADGYARGEGVAAVVLKTLSAALADGDEIDCLIREVGVNQDGRTTGITMPSAEAQRKLIVDTYRRVNLDPCHDRPQFFEAHGTGTPTGDPLEAEAISRAFFPPNRTRNKGEEDPVLYVGSIKTVIGHTEGTAGIAGLLKAALALKHGFIPPNLLFDELNPAIAPFYTNLRILTKGIPWPKIPFGGRFLASVNSFGFGGTNAHAILERFQPPQDETRISGHSPVLRPVVPFLFSAASERALRNMLKGYVSFLKSASGQSLDLANVNYTLHSRRSVLPVKATFAAFSASTLVDQMQAALESDSDVGIRTTYSSSSRKKVLGIFTGQGAQWPGMGRALALESEFVRRRLRDFDIVLQDELPVADRPKWSLEREMTTDAASSRVDLTEYSQPLCTALQLVLVDLLHRAGVSFDAVIGHSSGEIAASYAAGYIKWEDAIKIAYYRGFHVSKSRGGANIPVGAMLAVGTTKDDAEELCDMPEFKGRVSLAANNAPSSVTLSGDADAVAELEAIFQDEKRFARTLKVDQAYHSHHMQPHATPYRESLRLSNIEPCSKEKRSTRPAWISSVHPDVEPGARFELSADYWVENLVRPVLFYEAVTRAINEHGWFDLGLEVGPHPALKGPTLQTVELITGSKISYTGTTKRNGNDIEALGMALGSIWTHIGPTAVNMTAFEDVIFGIDTKRTRRIAKNLPSYPWDHEQTYWYESRVARVFRTRPFPIHPLLGTRQLSGPDEFQWRNFLQVRELPWLSGHKIQQQILFPAAGYIVAAFEAALLMAEGSSVDTIELSDLTIPNAIAFPDENASVETIITLSRSASETGQGRIAADFTFHSPQRPDSDKLSLACSGRIDIILSDAKSVSNAALSLDTAFCFDNPVGIETDYFYSFLSGLGYGYTDSFRALSGLERSFNESKAILHDSGRETHGLLIHPGTLDNCFQAIMLAIGFPEDGVFRELHVPTRIRHIAVDARRCQQHLESESQLQVLAVATKHEEVAFDGDVHLVAADGKDVLVRVEGLEVTPVSASSDPPHIFSSFIWKMAAPRGELAPITIAPDPALHELILVSQQACIYYMQLAKKDIANIGLEQAPAHYKHFASYIEYILDRVAAGTQAFTKPEWLQISQPEMAALMGQYADNIVIRTIRAVGENLAAAIRGECDMLEPLMRDGLLDEFYAKSTGMAEGSESLAALVRQISHRYPRMDILEIGAGTGGATKSILARDLQFGSYTFTDISMGFFEKARTTFAPFKDSMSYKILDISSDIVKQGFTPHSYDVIVASCVLHATSSLDVTLQNCYTLLKPGGWLLMLEQTDHHGPLRAGFIFGCLPGWWLGIDDDRQLSPSVTSARWHRHFKAAGFGDISTIKSPEVNECINPNFVICAQASDHRIDFLRQPLLRPGDQVPLEHLVLVGGSNPATDSLAKEILDLLSPWHKGSVSRRRSIAEVSEFPLLPRSCVLNIVDLDEPVFENMAQATLDGLKSTLKQSSILLWVTCGSRHANPYANMSVGFGRAARLEFNQIRLQFLDLDPGRPFCADTIAAAFLRLNALEIYASDVDQPSILWSIENELAQDETSKNCEKRSNEDCLLVPRLYRMVDAYDRLNSISRLTSLPVAGPSGGEILTIQVASSKYTVYQSLDARRFAELDSQSRDIESSISLLSPLQIAPGVSGYLILGKCLSSDEILVALSSTQSSVVRASSFAKVSPSVVAAHQEPFLAHLIASLFFDSLDSRLPGSVLMHEPDPALTDALRYHAARHDRSIFFTTSDASKQDGCIFVHTLASDRSTLAALPGSITYFVDLSRGGSEAKRLGSRLNTLLPPCIERLRFFGPLSGNMPAPPSGALSKSISQKLSRAVKTASDAYKKSTSSSLMKRVSIGDLHSVPPELNEPKTLDWHTEGGKEIPVTLQAADSQNLFRSDKTYVLFGYSSDLAQNMCTWMAEHGLRHVVLTSRSPNVRPHWLQRMHDLGVHVRIEQNDVTDKAQVQVLVENIRRTMPEVRGLVSGAMVLEDASIPSLTMDLVEKQLRPKVQGTVHLHEAFKQQPLDFFICLSSMTAQFGNRGQSVYAAGNLFMSALMAQRRRSGLAGSVIHIGPVMGAGFLARQPLKYTLQIRKRSGFDGVAERHLHQAFAEAMFIGHPHSPSGADGEIAIGNRHPVFEEGLREQWYELPIFQHYVLPERKTIADGKTDTSLFKTTEQQLSAVTTKEQVHEVLRRELAARIRAILQLSTSSNDTDILRQGAFELGIDSLVAIELRSWIMREIHVDLPLFKILGSSALSDVVELVAQQLPEELVPNVKDSTDDTTEIKASKATGSLQTEQVK